MNGSLSSDNKGFLDPRRPGFNWAALVNRRPRKLYRKPLLGRIAGATAMFRANRRDRKWKSKWKWERAQRRKRRMEEQLKEDLRPNDVLHFGGAVADVHVVRSLSGRKEYYFEFGCYATDRRRFFVRQVFSEYDLDDLEQVLSLARSYRDPDHRARGMDRKGFTNGYCGNRHSNAFKSRLPVRWE